MKSQHRKAPHGADPSREVTAAGDRASPDDDLPLSIDLGRVLEAERRLELDLVAIEAEIWDRIQERLKSATYIADQIDTILRDDIGYIARLIASFGVPPSDVEDVTQDVLCSVVQSSTLYDASRGTLRTWLYRVSFLRSRTFLDRAYRRREELEGARLDESGEAITSILENDDPERRAIAGDERRVVWEAIEGIALHRRAVFIAYEIMEMGMEEIAEALGIPKSTAWGRLQSARKEFESALKKGRARDAFGSVRRRG